MGNFLLFTIISGKSFKSELATVFIESLKKKLQRCLFRLFIYLFLKDDAIL